MSEGKKGPDAPSVQYNWLGRHAGIKVSNICLGAGTFAKPAPAAAGEVGEREQFPRLDEAQSHAILDRYHELGGNFIDTANVYSDGQSEEVIGSWLSKHDRSSIVVATKVRFGAHGSLLEGLSRGSIMSNLEASLRRLNTDYIDLYYSHAWDAGVKLEETLRAFNDVVRSGKVRYVGLSNVTGAQLQRVVDLNQFMGFNQAVVLQQQYNLLERNSDTEVVPTCRAEGIGLLPWSPLHSGLLTGKFKRDDGDVVTSLAGTRLGWMAAKPKERALGFIPYVEEYRDNEDYWTLMDTMATVAKQQGKSQSQVALRWLLQKDFIPSVVIGVKTIAQLEDNMGAGAGWSLTDEQMAQLDGASFKPADVYPYSTIALRNKDRVRN